MNKILQSSMMLLAGAALLASCQKDDRTVNLTAIIADQQAGNAKVYIDGVYGCWQQGDEVRLRSSGSNDEATYELAVSTGAASAQITGVTEGAPYTAGYPASCVTAINDGIVTIEVPAEQSYVEAAIYNGAATNEQRIVCPMAAYSPDGSTLKFYNVVAMLAVTVTNSESSSLTLYAVEVESDKSPLSGTATVTVNTDAATSSISSNASTSNNVTLTFDTPVTLAASASKTVYIPVLPIGSGEGEKSTLTVHVKATANADGTGSKYTFHDESSSAISIAQNQIGNVPITLNTSNPETEVNDYFWGQGKPECPYLIESETDLTALRTLVSNNNEETQNDYNTSKRYYLQTKNITLTTWSAIGSSTLPFKANFDGGNHSINGLVNNAPFQCADGASIKNLTVRSTSGLTTNGYSRGGIVNIIKSNKVTISNCTTHVNITESAYSLFNNGYGGVVGLAQTNFEIENCVSYGNITPTNTSSNHIGMCAGGIVGHATSTGVINNCTNQGTIGGTRAYHSGYFGGIIGFSNSKVEMNGCKNGADGIVKMAGYCGTKSDSYGGCGGMAGALWGANNVINNCENQGMVQTTTTAGAAIYIGGMVGIVCNNTSFTNCHNKGIVQDNHTAKKNVNIGGIVGYFYVQGSDKTLTIDGCTNGADAVVRCKDGTSQTCCGGLVGYIFKNNSSYKATLTISNSYNYGDVGLSSTSIEADKAYVGGLVGYTAQYSIFTIENCGNEGTVCSYYVSSDESTSEISCVGGIIGRDASQNQCTGIRNCYNSGTVKGGAFAGGIVGIIAAATNNVPIKNSYNAGTISTAYFAGGIVGKVASSQIIENCYSATTFDNIGSHYGAIGEKLSKYTDIVHCFGTEESAYYSLTEASSNTPYFTQFTSYGTIGTTTTALCTNLNTWVSTNNGESSTYKTWQQSTTDGNPTELPHF